MNDLKFSVPRIEIDIKDIEICNIRYIFQQIRFDLEGIGINSEEVEI